MKRRIRYAPVTIVLALAGLAAFAGAAEGVAPVDSIDGAWRLLEYRLASGQIHALAGTIFFVDGRWQVAFLVLDDAGTPQRGSAEGGTYTVEGDQLVFRHELNFSFGNAMPGLPASELRMSSRPPAEAAAEPVTFAIDGTRLVIDFPSGNQIRFERVPASG